MLGTHRFALALLGTFAIAGLALASHRALRVMSYAVPQRRYKLGIRLALGARGRQVVRLVATRGAATVAIGIAAAVGRRNRSADERCRTGREPEDAALTCVSPVLYRGERQVVARAGAGSSLNRPLTIKSRTAAAHANGGACNTLACNIVAADPSMPLNPGSPMSTSATRGRGSVADSHKSLFHRCKLLPIRWHD